MISSRSTRRNPGKIEQCYLPANTRHLPGPNQGPIMAAVDIHGDEIHNFEDQDGSENGLQQTLEERLAAMEFQLLTQTRETAATRAESAANRAEIVAIRAINDQQQVLLLKQEELMQQLGLQQHAATLRAQQPAQMQYTGIVTPSLTDNFTLLLAAFIPVGTTQASLDAEDIAISLLEEDLYEIQQDISKRHET
jgi:hypothetical protein